MLSVIDRARSKFKAEASMLCLKCVKEVRCFDTSQHKLMLAGKAAGVPDCIQAGVVEQDGKSTQLYLICARVFNAWRKVMPLLWLTQEQSQARHLCFSSCKLTQELPQIWLVTQYSQAG